MRSKYIFLYVDSLIKDICHSVNLSWRIELENAGYIFAYLYGGDKKIFNYNFGASLKGRGEGRRSNYYVSQKDQILPPCSH